MKYYIARFVMDWADEFYYKSSSIVTEEEKNKFETKIASYDQNMQIEIGFGTNEELEGTAKDFLRSFSYTEVSKEEYDVLKKYEYEISGMGLDYSDIIENFENIEDEEEDF